MASGRLPLILTIDDESAIRKSFKNYLEDLDYDVIEAKNGREGLELFEKEKPDLVLVDLRMPEIDGMAVLETVVKTSPDIPIIVVSGTGIIGDVIKALQRGAWDYILKPVEDMTVLQYAVEKALERSMLLYENRLYREHLEEEVAKQTKALKAAADALGESEEKYRDLVENASSIILKTDGFGNITFFNEFAQTFFGYQEQEIMGENIIGTLVEPSGGHLKDFNSVINEIKNAPKDYYAGFEYNNICKDGKKVWISWTHKPLFDEEGNILEVLSVGNDVTENKKTEAERLKLAVIVEQADESVMIFDVDGKINYINPAMVQLTGFSTEELIGKNMQDLNAETKVKEELKQVVSSGSVWRGNVSLGIKDGSRLEMEIKISPVKDKNGNIVSFVSVGRDITKELMLEEQLRQTQKLEAIGTLAGGIAHDFNNILSAVIGFTELSLIEVEAESSTYMNMNEVLKAGNRARDLVKQILAFSRQSEQDTGPLQISPIVKEALKLLRASLPTTIEIKENIKSDSVVIADPTQIHQIIMNLCVNAGHAMHPQGGVLDVSMFDLDLDDDFVSGQPGLVIGRHVCVKVSDTGCGISSEVQKRIFEPFFTTKEKDVGTGMGLSVVHGIVISSGGEILVESEPGKGSVFTIYLPISEATEAAEIETPKLPQTGMERILFVDDEQIIVDMTSMMLEKLGYDVVGKSGSVEALEYFNAHADDVDLVITDMTMPKMTGLILAEEIKKIRPSVPIVLCTGFSLEISGSKKKDSCVDALIMKPVSRKELSGVIRAVLGDGEV